MVSRVRPIRRLAAVLFVVAPLALAVACSDDPPQRPPPAGQSSAQPPPPVGAVGTNEGGSGDAGGDGGTEICNTIANNGLLVDRIGVNGEPPVSTGGTIVEGRYDLTAYSIYVGVGGVAGPTGLTAKASMVLNAGRRELVLEVGGNAPTKEIRTLTSYSATGSSLLFTNICPANGGAEQVQYTANEASVTITDPISKEQMVFTKR